MNFTLLRHNQEAVMDRLRQQKYYDNIFIATTNELDKLIALMDELKLFSLLEKVRIERERAGIPDALLLRELFLLPILRIANPHQAGSYLLTDAGVLRLLGFTAQQIREGFNQRGTEEKCLPHHFKDLYDLLERVQVKSIDTLRRGAIKELYRRNLLRGGTYAVDGSGIGSQWRVVVLLHLEAGHEVVVNWRVIKTGSELPAAKEMVAEMAELAGFQPIRRLLMDAGYVDGAWLKSLHKQGIEAMVRVREDMQIYQQMVGLVRGDPQEWKRCGYHRVISGHKHTHRVELAYLDELETWDSYDGKLWGLLVKEPPKKEGGAETVWGLVATYDPGSGREFYQTWRERWGIENTGFRELKEGWWLEKECWGRHETAVKVSVAFKCLGYNYVRIFNTRQGSRLVARGIRSFHQRVLKSRGPEIVIVSGGEYAILHVEEFAAMLGAGPQESLRPRRSVPRARRVRPPTLPTGKPRAAPAASV